MNRRHLVLGSLFLFAAASPGIYLAFRQPYPERVFSRIELGMTEKEVEAAIGQQPYFTLQGGMYERRKVLRVIGDEHQIRAPDALFGHPKRWNLENDYFVTVYYGRDTEKAIAAELAVYVPPPRTLFDRLFGL